MNINNTNILKIIKEKGPISYPDLFKFFVKDNNYSTRKIKNLIKKLKKRTKIVSVNGLLKVPGSVQKKETKSADDAAGDFLEIIKKHKIRHDFSPMVLKESDRTFSISHNAKKFRQDFRDQLCVTIDSADAKDLDDAIYLEKKNRGWRLFVHIADVSYYVKQDSATDKEALKRGTSIYLTDKVVPMLPRSLSNGICSLNANEERLCVSVIIDLNSKGKIKHYSFTEGVIIVKKRYTYKRVNKLLDMSKKEVPVDDKAFYPMLKDMKQLALLLSANRFKTGSLDFDVDELKIICDEKSNPVEIKRRERLISHRIVEEFMLKANKAAARFLGAEGNALFRIHEDPDPEKIKNFFEFMHKLNYRIKNPKKTINTYLQKILNSVKGTKNARIVNTLLLRSMKQAIYHTENRGHFGLGFKDYTHFTSPIRRYPDLIVHRLIKNKLGLIKGPKSKKLSNKAFLTKVANRASKKEREAMEAEREMVKRKCARILKPHIGEKYSGVVSGLTNFGLFVEISPYGIEGLVRNKYLDGYYLYDEEYYVLRGTKGKNYELGSPVEVELISVNIKRGYIDFKIV